RLACPVQKCVGGCGDDEPTRKTVDALGHRLEERRMLVAFRPLLPKPFVFLKIFEVSPDWRRDHRNRRFCVRFAFSVGFYVRFAFGGRGYFHSSMRSRYA